MKKIIVFTFCFLLALGVAEAGRPTNDWRVVYRDRNGSHTVTFEAAGASEALREFRRAHCGEDVRVVGVCQLSYLSCE